MLRTLHRRHRRNAIVRQARTLPLPLRAQTFRTALYGGETDQKLLLALAELAIESGDPAMPMFADALRAGRRVKVGTFKVLGFSTDPNISAITAAEIEDALSQVQVGDEDGD
jgi:hypothetical protein